MHTDAVMCMLYAFVMVIFVYFEQKKKHTYI